MRSDRHPVGARLLVASPDRAWTVVIGLARPELVSVFTLAGETVSQASLSPGRRSLGTLEAVDATFVLATVGPASAAVASHGSSFTGQGNRWYIHHTAARQRTQAASIHRCVLKTNFTRVLREDNTRPPPQRRNLRSSKRSSNRRQLSIVLTCSRYLGERQSCNASLTS